MSERALRYDTIVNGRYRIAKVIGEGGFGITYLADDVESGKVCALKEYFPLQSAFRNTDTGEVCVYGKSGEINENKDGLSDHAGDKARLEFDKGLARFRKEADILKEYRHLQGIVRVWDCFPANNTAYIVMDHIDGMTLKRYVELHGGFEYDELIMLLSPIMKSLATLHRHGLIHRDISPDNIMIGMDNELYLIDFGSAKAMEQGRTSTVLLKAGYAPPEQYLHDGKMGAWTDVYGMCGTIYTALGGGVPTDAVARLQGKALDSPDERGVQIDDWQWSAVRKGMSVRSAGRYRDMEELYDALTVSPADEDIVTVYGSDEDSVRRYAVEASDGEGEDTSNYGKNVYGESLRRQKISSGRLIGLLIATALIVTGVVYAALYAGISQSVSLSENDSEADDNALTEDRYNNESDTEAVKETGGTQICEMPDVVGLSNADAYKEIRESDSSIHIKTQRSYSDEVDSGIVISQDVEPDTRYNEGAISEITIVVSMGRKTDEAASVKVNQGTGSTGNTVTGKSSTKSTYDVKSDGNETVDFYLDD